MNNTEFVICAAIWIDDGNKHYHQPINIETGIVFCGHRHCSIFSQLAAYKIKQDNRGIQGFLTSHNRFLTRKEAAELVKSNDQKMVTDRKSIRDNLYSENLY